MAYTSEPLFSSGIPETARAPALETAGQSAQAITASREQTTRRIAARLGIPLSADVWR